MSTWAEAVARDLSETSFLRPLGLQKTLGLFFFQKSRPNGLRVHDGDVEVYELVQAAEPLRDTVSLRAGRSPRQNGLVRREGPVAEVADEDVLLRILVNVSLSRVK